VPLNPPAQRRDQDDASASRDRRQIRARPAPGPVGHNGQGHAEPGAGSRGQRVRLPGWHAEHIREVRAVETMAQVQLDDLTVGGAQRAKRGAHHGGRVHLPIAGAGISHRVGHPGRLIARRGDADRQPAMAFVAGYREQPRPHAAGIIQPRDLG
jgi:hypothetical protein